jgi:hypothetical protein
MKPQKLGNVSLYTAGLVNITVEDIMSRVLVWKCDHDGKLFEDHEKYLAHLKVLAKARREQRRIDKFKAQRQAFLDLMCSTVSNFEELEQFIADNWQQFVTNYKISDVFFESKRGIEYELIKIKITGNWNGNIGNTHSCPKTGVTNWHRKPELPSGYPGWRGWIEFETRGWKRNRKGQLVEINSGPGSRVFERTPVCTGSGSGVTNQGTGATSYGYDLTLWADDWPAMVEAQNRAQVWNHLSDQNMEFA